MKRGKFMNYNKKNILIRDTQVYKYSLETIISKTTCQLFYKCTVHTLARELHRSIYSLLLRRYSIPRNSHPLRKRRNDLCNFSSHSFYSNSAGV